LQQQVFVLMRPRWFAGLKFSEDTFIAEVKMEIVVRKEQV
jgi:hypothetical protein